MLVLDTDHISTLGDPAPAGVRLLSRLEQSGAEVAATVVTVQENLQGWLAQIAGARTPDREIAAFERFQRRVAFFGEWTVLPWDAESVALFRGFRSQGIRIGTNDLRIASIVIAHDATLLTRNTVDFARVPGLKFENWLD